MPLVLHSLTFEMGHQLSRLKNECTRNWQTERGEESNGKWHKLARVNSPVILQGWKIRCRESWKRTKGEERRRGPRERKIPVCTTNMYNRIEYSKIYIYINISTRILVRDECKFQGASRNRAVSTLHAARKTFVERTM